MSSKTNLTDLSLLELFNMEIKSQVSVLNQNLLALEHQAESTEELTELMRAAHSIKGAARIVQIDSVVALAHVMEDYFLALQEEKIAFQADQVDVLLQATDFLLEISEDCISDSEAPSTEDERINSLVNQIAYLGQKVIDSLEPDGLTAHCSEVGNSEVNQSDANHSSSLQQASLQQTSLDSRMGRPPLIYFENRNSTTDVSYSDGKITVDSDPDHSLAIPLKKEDSVTSGFQQNGKFIPTASETTTTQPLSSTERVVRVGANHLNRLMGLAGESLVEAKWLEPFADSLLDVKQRQTHLFTVLENLQDLLKQSHPDRRIQEQLNLAYQAAGDCQQILSDRHNELEVFSQRSANLAERLYRQAIATHMRPFGDTGSEFPRLVRDLARQLGKRVDFEILGASTLVDRDILERLKAPLTHILRICEGCGSFEATALSS